MTDRSQLSARTRLTEIKAEPRVGGKIGLNFRPRSQHKSVTEGESSMRVHENVSDDARFRRARRSAKLRWLCVLMAGIAISGAVVPRIVRAAVALVAVDVVSVADGYRASKLRGTTVVNDANEKIGELDDLIVGKDRVLFAIIEVGGFLGLGSRLVAVPYSSLQISDDGRRIVLPGATKEQLQGLPVFKYR
jgi:hypothetical protein